MAARLAPYLRYYASQRPTDDHGARPAVLVVFDDEVAASHFLRVARKEMERAGAEVPLCSSPTSACLSGNGCWGGRGLAPAARGARAAAVAPRSTPRS